MTMARIYIVGPVASGKSTLAKSLAQRLQIPCASLDEFRYVQDLASAAGNRKRGELQTQKLFDAFIQQPKWIIEDVGRQCFQEGLKQADKIILLDLASRVRKYRILKRWTKQRLGLEACQYKPSLQILKLILEWHHNYDTGVDNLKQRIAEYNHKVLVCKNSRQVKKLLPQESSAHN